MDLLIATLWMRHFEMLLTTKVVVPLFLSLSLSKQFSIICMKESTTITFRVIHGALTVGQEC